MERNGCYIGNVQGDSDEEEAPVGETDVQRTE